MILYPPTLRAVAVTMGLRPNSFVIAGGVGRGEGVFGMRRLIQAGNSYPSHSNPIFPYVPEVP